MEIPKDLYLYLINFADDKTILNMLSVNKKYNNDIFFKTIIERRYPYLINFKRDETWKSFYLRLIHYISKLEEKYNYIVDSEIIIDPETIYTLYEKHQEYQEMPYPKLSPKFFDIKFDNGILQVTSFRDKYTNMKRVKHGISYPLIHYSDIPPIKDILTNLSNEKIQKIKTWHQ